jgi:hypothetical protein
MTCNLGLLGGEIDHLVIPCFQLLELCGHHVLINMSLLDRLGQWDQFREIQPKVLGKPMN